MATVERRTTSTGASYRVRFDDYSSGARVQRSKTFPVAGPTRAADTAARRAAETFAAGIESGTAAPESALTVADLAARWLEARAGRVQPSTLIHYRTVLTAHVLPALGSVRLSRVTPLMIERWLSHQRLFGCSASTLRDRWTILSGLFRQAVRWRLSPYNPCDGVQAPPQGKPRERVLSEGEARTLLAACTEAIDLALVRVLLYGGLRIGEALALRWTDVDLSDGLLSVRRTLSRTQGGTVARDGTKAGDGRVVPLDAITTEALGRLRQERVELLDGLGLPFDAAGFVFGSALSAKAPSDRVARRRLRALSAAAKMPPVNPHALRHSCVTQLRRAGVPETVIAARVGHAAVAMTRKYDHVSAEDQRRAVERLREAIEG